MQWPSKWSGMLKCVQLVKFQMCSPVEVSRPIKSRICIQPWNYNQWYISAKAQSSPPHSELFPWLISSVRFFMLPGTIGTQRQRLSMTGKYLCTIYHYTMYCIYPKYSDTSNPYHNCHKIWKSPFYYSWTSIAWTDGSFIMSNSNSFFSPYKILPIAQENKYLGKFSYFIIKLYVVCTH